MNLDVSMDQLFLEKVNATIENHLSDENFRVVELADALGISRWQLNRRLKDISGQSPSQMIREFRLKKAFELLQNNVANVSEVSYRVGFGNPTYFNTCFSQYFGYPPGKVKRIKSRGLIKKYSISRGYIFISLSVALLIVVLLITNIIVTKNNTGSAEARIQDKSIAVLPFKCLSADAENQHLADGVMEAILLNLSKIEDLKVMDRTSVEQYRVTDKTSAIICKELDVVYLLEGSFQKHGDQASLILKLIEPRKEGHVWNQNYDRKWADVFSVQSEVALDVARELQAVITPEEKRLLQKIPNINTTAFDYYFRGRGEHLKYQLDQNNQNNRNALESAEELYHKALECDSAFAQAYAGLAWIYEDKYFWKTFLAEDFLDTMLILADRALSYDDELAEAYVIRGDYYRYNSQKEQAIKEYDEALRFNPNEWRAYWNKGDLYNYDDFVKTLENYHRAASLNRGNFLPHIYRAIGSTYADTDFKELSIYFMREALNLDDDSAIYYGSLGAIEESYCNFSQAIEYYEKSLVIDSLNWWYSFRLGIVYGFLGQFEESLACMKLYERRFLTPVMVSEIRSPHYIFRLGHAYHVNGLIEKGDSIMNEGFGYYNRLLELQRHYDQDLFIFRVLSAMHAFMENKDKAFEYLRLMNESQRFPFFMIKDLKNDPLLISIRDEPEFQQIVRDIEAKCQAEHERVSRWMEENDML